MPTRRQKAPFLAGGSASRHVDAPYCAGVARSVRIRTTHPVPARDWLAAGGTE